MLQDPGDPLRPRPIGVGIANEEVFGIANEEVFAPPPAVNCGAPCPSLDARVPSRTMPIALDKRALHNLGFCDSKQSRRNLTGSSLLFELSLEAVRLSVSKSDRF
jgi:hypothetical protein